MECIRCGGSGRIKKFNHIEGGRCFDCEGKGYSLTDKEIMIEFKKDSKVIARKFYTKDANIKDVKNFGREIGADSMKAYRKN